MQLLHNRHDVSARTFRVAMRGGVVLLLAVLALASMSARSQAATYIGVEGDVSAEVSSDPAVAWPAHQPWSSPTDYLRGLAWETAYDVGKKFHTSWCT